ncbi:hypothetical protein ACA910_016262 [Epithemia clementina (nom. ined.)]
MTSTKSAVRLKVTESGSEAIHDPNTAPELPTSPEQFLTRFRNNFELNVLERPSPNELVLEFIHVDTSFVNALRRILLAEIPTVAIENVYISKNSSIIHDEVLAHRLGLVPIMADARLMDDFIDENGENNEEEDEGGANDRNTLVFRLEVACTHAEARAAAGSGTAGRPSSKGGTAGAKQPDGQEEEVVDNDDEELDNLVAPDVDLETIAKEAASKQPYQFPKDRPYTKHVYSSDLEWIPQGDQADRFIGEKHEIRPIYPDILLAKLRPGQSIELEAHARKGIGKDHAKYSPVCTASYRLMPHVELLHDVYDEDAEELVHVYEPGVFRLVPTTPGGSDPPGTRQKAVVHNPYACTMSRNFMRHATLAKAVKITRLTDHFIFSIESVGMCSPAVLLAEALRVLQRKCQNLMDLTDAAATNNQ